MGWWAISQLDGQSVAGGSEMRDRVPMQFRPSKENTGTRIILSCFGTKYQYYSLDGKVYYNDSQSLRNTTKSHSTTNLKWGLWEGKKNQKETDCHCSVEKQQGTEQKTGFMSFSWEGGWKFIEWSFPVYRQMGFQVESLGFSLCRVGARFSP